MTRGFENLKFSEIKDKIFFRVVGKNKIREYSEKNNKILYSKLANEMFMIYGAKVEEKKTLIFTEDIAKRMNCSMEKIIECAEKNTEKIYPPIMKNVENTIFEVMTGASCSTNLLETENMVLGSKEGKQMHVLTNSSARYGAGVIFYKGILRKISRIFDSDFYMIPSSVHEFILLPKYVNIKADELNYILTDVNKGFLREDEILGDKVLFYSSKKGKIL